jgi:hypothetical protein
MLAIFKLIQNKEYELLAGLSPLQLFWHSTSPCRIHDHQNIEVLQEYSTCIQKKNEWKL